MEEGATAAPSTGEWPTKSYKIVVIVMAVLGTISTIYLAFSLIDMLIWVFKGGLNFGDFLIDIILLGCNIAITLFITFYAYILIFRGFELTRSKRFCFLVIISGVVSIAYFLIATLAIAFSIANLITLIIALAIDAAVVFLGVQSHKAVGDNTGYASLR